MHDRQPYLRNDYKEIDGDDDGLWGITDRDGEFDLVIRRVFKGLCEMGLVLGDGYINPLFSYPDRRKSKHNSVAINNGLLILNPLLIATLLCFGEVLPEAELKVLGVLIKYRNGGIVTGIRGS